MRMVLLFLLLLLLSGCVSQQGFRTDDGRGVWPAVGDVEYSLEGDKVYFVSLGTKVAGLYVDVANASAAAVVLPGALVGKGQVGDLSSLLAGKGVSHLILDVRGVGETAGGEAEADSLKAFRQGKMSENHKVVYDVMVAAKILEEKTGLPVFILGESNGGRLGIIAASQIQVPVLVISSAGYGMGEPYDERTRFYKSIDADNYVANVPKLALVHPKDDPAIPLYFAERTFSVCTGEKKMWRPESEMHGFSKDMEIEVTEAISFLIGIR